jgi:PAS domain S-box-containing protein
MPKKNLSGKKRPGKKKRRVRAGTKSVTRLPGTVLALTDLMFEVDRHGRIYDYVSPIQEELYANPEEFLGKSVTGVLPEEPAGIIMGAIMEASRSGRHAGARYSLDFPEGRRWYELSISAMGDPKKADTRFMALVRNITESMKNLEALARSEEKYRTIIDSIQEAYFETDLAGRITFVNKSACEMSGYTNDEFIGMSYRRLVDSANQKNVFEVFSRVFKTGKPEKSFDWEVIRKDGVHRIIETSVSLIIGSDGAPAGFRGVIHDITDRKKAGEVSRIFSVISEKILNATLSIEELAHMIMIHAKELTDSEDAYLTEFNPGIYESPEKKDVTALNPRLVASTMTDEVRRAMQGDVQKESILGMLGYIINEREAFFENDASNHALHGNFLDCNLSVRRFLAAPAIMQNKLIGLIFVVNSPRDYTESDLQTMKRLAEMFAIAVNRIWNEKQIRVSLKEKELLLKEIHHRVKNNMQIISSLLGLQSSHVKDDRDAALFEVSQHRVRSMALVHEKLYQSEGLSGIDFQDYITDLVEELHNSYYLGGRVAIVINAKNILVDIDDAIPCSLIIHELVSNAMKHAFPDERTGNITIEFFRNGGDNVLRIRDDGVGLPDGFDYQDTGSLGLQLVNALTQQLRGSIEVDTSNGTAFTIVFRGKA